MNIFTPLHIKNTKKMPVKTTSLSIKKATVSAVDPPENKIKDFVYDITKNHLDRGILSITFTSAMLFETFQTWGKWDIDNEYLLMDYIDQYADELDTTETGVNGIQRSDYAPVERTFDFLILKRHFKIKSKRILKTPTATPRKHSPPSEPVEHDESPSKSENCPCPMDGCNHSGSKRSLPFHYGKDHLQHLVCGSSNGTLSCTICGYITNTPRSMHSHIAKCSPESPYFANKKASTKASAVKPVTATSTDTPSVKQSVPSVKRSKPSVKRNDMIRKTQIAEIKSYAEAKYNSEMEQLQNQKMQIDARMEEIRSNFQTSMSNMDGLSAIEASKLYAEMLQEESENIVL
jgi:hypothetical protein